MIPVRAEEDSRRASVTLNHHFYERLWSSNDLGSGDGAGLVHALCIVAAPNLLIAFWAAALFYSRDAWALAKLHLLFVLYSFSVLGSVATIYGESCFLSRDDLQILLPLPVHKHQLVKAKTTSLCRVFAMFFFAANLFGVITIPMLGSHGMLRGILAHIVAVSSAGLMGMLLSLLLQSLTLWLCPARLRRAMMFALRTVLIMYFTFSVLSYVHLADHIRLFGSDLRTPSFFIPAFGNLSLYEVVLKAPTASPAMRVHSLAALSTIGALVILLGLAYPFAWKSVERAALEDTDSGKKSGYRLLSLFDTLLLKQPRERAIYHFVIATTSRFEQYRTYLAAYFGVGLAIVSTLAIGISGVDVNGVSWLLWRPGLEAGVPFLLCWTALGLRGAFRIPVDIDARWVFRTSNVSVLDAMNAVKAVLTMVMSCVILSAALAFLLARFSWKEVLGHVLWSSALALFLAQALFVVDFNIPFTRPRLPTRSNLPLTLALYLFGVPAVTVWFVYLEHWGARNTWHLIGLVGIFTATQVFVVGWARNLLRSPSEDPFFDESEDDMIVLGLVR